ncbi:MAG: hypothetical protein IPK15_13340 [Verrucomicrobia bacterium]|nr:hypothetical protein [Verrucomicrobiota bacterium]
MNRFQLRGDVIANEAAGLGSIHLEPEDAFAHPVEQPDRELREWKQPHGNPVNQCPYAVIADMRQFVGEHGAKAFRLIEANAVSSDPIGHNDNRIEEANGHGCRFFDFDDPDRTPIIEPVHQVIPQVALPERFRCFDPEWLMVVVTLEEPPHWGCFEQQEGWIKNEPDAVSPQDAPLNSDGNWQPFRRGIQCTNIRLNVLPKIRRVVLAILELARKPGPETQEERNDCRGEEQG